MPTKQKSTRKTTNRTFTASTRSTSRPAGRYGTRKTTGTKSAARKTTATKSAARKTTTTAARTKNPASGYKTCYQSFSQKVDSWRTLYNQTFGAAKTARPTPTTLNTFANWINKGAIVHQISASAINKLGHAWYKDFKGCKTPTSCRQILTRKFGKTTIKAVTRAKNGAYLVATAPTYKGKPFNFGNI
jgi:Ni,Fe-hydrogenase I large subunit